MPPPARLARAMRLLARMSAVRAPRVTIHYAQTLDGRIAARDGSSRWISSERSLRFAHRLRSEHDAVMVGVGTVLADDPRLTVRLVEGSSPLRVIVDSALRIPLEARVVVDGAADTLVATTARAPAERAAALRERGVDVQLTIADAHGRVDLHELLAQLADRGVSSVLIEGGRELITSALRERIVDRLVVCIAPKILGRGIDAIGDLDLLLEDAIELVGAEVRRLGPDLILDAVLERVALAV